MAFGRRNKGKDTSAAGRVDEPEIVDPEEIDPYLEQKKGQTGERELYVDEAVRGEEEPVEVVAEAAENVTEEVAEPATEAVEAAEAAEADLEMTDEITDFADQGLTDPNDDFEFVSEETVKDKTMTAEPAEVEKGTPRAKTDRRNADSTDRKRAKHKRARRRRGPTIIVIVIIAAIVAFFGFRYFQNKAAEEQAQEAAEEQQEQEELVVDENISALITNYYSACASGETDVLGTYADSMTDLEKDLIKTKSANIESFNDILCQRTDGPEEGSYLVTVTDNMKFPNVDTQLAEVSVFYIKRNSAGIYLIDNAYGAFNRANHVSVTNPDVEQAINDFIESDMVKALQVEADNANEQAAQDEAFAAAKKAFDDAVAKWMTDNDAAIKEAAAAVAAGTEPVTAPAEDADAVEEAPAEDMEEAAGEGTEDSDADAAVEEQTEDLPETVYATEAVRIRTDQDMEADYVTTVYPGDPMDVVGYTEGWYHVKSGDSEGYVSEEYVSTSQD